MIEAPRAWEGEESFFLSLESTPLLVGRGIREIIKSAVGDVDGRPLITADLWLLSLLYGGSPPWESG